MSLICSVQQPMADSTLPTGLIVAALLAVGIVVAVVAVEQFIKSAREDSPDADVIELRRGCDHQPRCEHVR